MNFLNGKAFSRTAAGLLISMGLISCTNEPPPPPSKLERFQEADGARKTQPSFSLSGDGSYMVGELIGKPYSAITYFDLTTGTVRDLQSANPDEYLATPDISDDGKRIAVVRSQDDRRALSDILILNTSGEVEDRISSCNGGYRSPAFSADGRKLVYLKYANAQPDENLSLRGTLRVSVWQPMEFDFESRTERPVVDLAWLSPGWIDYGPAGQAQFYARLQEPVGYDPEPTGKWAGKKHWFTPMQTSVLSNYTKRKYLDVFISRFVSLSPDAPDPENWVVPLFVNSDRGFAVSSRASTNGAVLGIGEKGFLAQEHKPGDPYDLKLISWDGATEQVISSSKDPEYEAAISRDGCVILDSRKPLKSLRNVPNVVTLRNICQMSEQSLSFEHDLVQGALLIRSDFENDC